MNSFNELTLSEPLRRAINDLGYETPSPIQQQALPILLGEPTDFIGLAATGTGKTAAFSIPLLERIDPTKKVVQGLILCPTRELAQQVAGQIELLAKFKKIKVVTIYGGSNYSDQIHGLRNGAAIVVGTPGRLIDHLERGTLNLSDVKTLILDEADEMISMGFKEDLESIMKAAPRETSNIWLFSATMSPEIRRVADVFLQKPAYVQVNRKEMLSTTVEQIFYPTRESDKPEVLCKIIETAEDFYGLVFCQTKALVTDLTQYMTTRGYKVDCLHGDKDQRARERTMQSFRDRKVSILICTDVASRGLDVKDVTHVVNYSIPRELDVYVHRIGRTARSGKSGTAISLVTPSHRSLIARIENMTKSRMKEARVPSRRDLGVIKIAKFLPQFIAQANHTRAAELLSPEWKTAIAAMTVDEIVGRFISMSAPEIFEDRDKSKPLLETVRAPQERESRFEGRSRGGGSRFRDDRRGGDRHSDRQNGDRFRGDRNSDRGERSFRAKPTFNADTQRNDQTGERDYARSGGRRERPRVNSHDDNRSFRERYRGNNNEQRPRSNWSEERT